MKKTCFTLLFILLISIWQPSIILAETIDSSSPKISNDSKEAVEVSSEETVSSESSGTSNPTELSNSRDTIDFTVSQETSEREVSTFDVSTTDIAAGTFGTSDWSIDDTGVLHIQQGEFDDTPEIGFYRQSPWLDYRNSINKIVFEGPVVASAIMERLFEGLSNVTEIENISYLDTSNTVNMQRTFADCASLVSLDLTSWDTSKVQDIFSLFYGCVNMENLDISTWNTQSITAITYAFANMTKLKALNLSNWNLSPMYSAQGVFMGDSSLESLDLSGFDMTRLSSNNAYSTSRFFQNTTALKELTLSSSFRFIGSNSSTNPELPLVPINDMYTGMWQNIGDGTSGNPNGADIWTSRELMSNFDLAPKNDTYVWQPVTRVAADVTVTYVDETGAEIHTAQSISGNIGETYDATSAEYKLTLDGYTLDESNLPENAKGTLSETAQTVVYNYTKNPVKAADVTVTYVDETGAEIHTAQSISGNIGETYDATSAEYKLTLDGYTLDESNLPENAKGTLSETAQTVVYNYTKNPVKAADVTVTYVDETGAELHDAQSINGNIGETYDATSAEYKLTLDGYTLDESNLPENAKGTLSETAQNVVYNYTKNPVKAADVTVTYVDETGAELHDAQSISGNIGETYDATSAEYKLTLDGYTLDESKLPEHMTGVLSDKPITVEYVYKKNPAKIGTITINYVDEAGKKIHDSKTISGNIGTSYDVSIANYKPIIDGYTLNENKLPKNAKGIVEKQNHTVTYVYSQNKEMKNNQKNTQIKEQLPLAGENNKKSLMFMGGGIIVLCGVLYLLKKRKTKR